MKTHGTDQLNWDDVRFCLAVINEGSVSAAAKALGVNQTTVSRRITALEHQLAVTLFDRSTSGWLLTAAGESIHQLAEQMRERAFAIQRSLTDGQQELSGKLRVTAVDVCLQRMLLPGLRAFADKYPEIQIELLASEETFDLAVQQADIAFRNTNNPPPNVVGKRISTFALGIYARPEVYAQYQRDPTSVSAITWREGAMAPVWLDKSFSDLQVRFRVNSLNVMFDMVLGGFGIGQLPCAMGDSSEELVRLPNPHQEPGMDFWVLSHIDLRNNARIRIFREFMIDYLQPFVPLIEGKGMGSVPEKYRYREIWGSVSNAAAHHAICDHDVA